MKNWAIGASGSELKAKANRRTPFGFAQGGRRTRSKCIDPSSLRSSDDAFWWARATHDETATVLVKLRAPTRSAGRPWDRLARRDVPANTTTPASLTAAAPAQ